MTWELKGWRSDTIDIYDGTAIVYAEPEPKIVGKWPCPECMTPSPVMTRATRSLADIPCDGNPVRISAFQPCCRCPSCGERFRPILPGVASQHSRMTMRLEDMIAARLSAGESCKAVADAVGLSVGTVWAVGRKAGVEMRKAGRPRKQQQQGEKP